MPDPDPDFAPLKARLAPLRYLLLADPAWYQDGQGAVWLDRLWARDLLRHLDYITDLTVLAPRRALPGASGDLVRLPDLPGLRFRHLPTGTTPAKGLLRLLAMLGAAWAAVKGADVVHSGAAGWPIAPGFVVNPVAVALRRPLIIVVESAFWRGDGSPRGLMGRAMGQATERLARWSSRRAALAVFTQEGYARELAQGARGRVMVAPASWIDEGDILSAPAALAAWDAKPAAPRFLLAARLTEGKGIPLALRALDLAAQKGQPLTLDIIGEGPLAGEVRAQAARLPGLRLLDPVPYGPAFFALLRGYHGVLVPSISDEQPRILFDAFGQAVPVIASDTAGHRAAVIPGETGLRFAPGDPAALLAAITGADDGALRRMGLSARDRAEGQTHRAMHLSRARALVEVLAPPPR